MEYFHGNNDLLRNKAFRKSGVALKKDNDVAVLDPDIDHVTPSLSADVWLTNVVERRTQAVQNTLNLYGLATSAWNGCD